MSNIWRMLFLKDFDELFSQNPDAVIANNASFAEENFAEAITKLVYSDNQTGDIGFVAECECGQLKGNYFIGKTCQTCHTEVRPNFVDELRHKVWISTPRSVEAFIHPIIYFNVSTWLSYGKKRSYLDDLLNPDSKMPEEVEKVFQGRGFNYVHANWDFIMDYFLNVHPKTRKKKQVPYMRMFLEYYRHLVFPSYLPILSNELHPITREGKSLKYTDDSSSDILQAIIDLATIEFSETATVVSQKKIEQVTFNSYMAYIEYLKKIIRKKLSVKKAMLRHHIFGTRLHGTFRSVIVPIMGEHYGDELHLPWNVGVSTYKLMIINVLMNKKDYSMVDALAKVSRAMITYDYEIDQIIQLLISECGYREYDKDAKKYNWINLKGLPVLWDRNPSLKMGSIQLLYVTKVKPSLKAPPEEYEEVDIIDQTVGMSTMVVSDPNADFDGDALNGIALYEVGEVKKFLSFHPINRMLSTKSPEAGTSIALAKQEVLLLNGFLNAEDSAA